MARRTPPDYAIDGEAVYIPADDSAWDHERIAREREEYAEKDATHPVDEYLNGTTRCRVTPKISEYLTYDKEPEEWVLAEYLPPSVDREVKANLTRQYILRRDGADLADVEVLKASRRASFLALKHGVKSVRNWGFPFELQRSADGALSDRTIANIDRLDPFFVDHIGNAIHMALRPLDGDEGK